MPSKAKKAKKAIVRTVKRSAKSQPKTARKAVKKVVQAKAVRKTIAKKAPARTIASKKPVTKSVKIQAKKVAPIVAIKQVAKPVATPVKQSATVTPIRAALAAPVAQAPVKKQEYKVGHYVVYPTHGVGKILAEETQKVGEVELRVFVISFEKDKMTLRVPVHRAAAAGLRNVSSTEELQKAFLTLKGRARAARGMWSRRAQEYEAKINSGNIHSVAEVVRDLHRNVDQAERSYSERMIYESALGRLVGELAAVEATSLDAATDKLMKVLKAQAAAA